jgi:hypothetical protein
MKNNKKATGLCCLSFALMAAPILGFLVFLSSIYGWQSVASATGLVILVVLAMGSVAAGGLIAINLLEKVDR